MSAAKGEKMTARKKALPGKSFTGALIDPDELVIVGLDTDDGPEHELYDARVKIEVSEALVRNVAAMGVLQPITVRIVKLEDGTKRCEVVAGRQRVRAAREANARIRETSGDDAVTVAVPAVNMDSRMGRGSSSDSLKVFSVMVSENELRQNDEILQKAVKAAKMLAMCGDEEEVAIKFGVTTRAVQNWIAIDSLCPEVKRAIRNGRVTATAAAELVSHPKETQIAMLQDLIEAAPEGKRPTQKDVKHAVKVKQAKAKGETADEGTETEDGFVIQAPPKRAIKNLLRSLSAQDLLTEDFLLGVRWVLGDLRTSDVPKLGKALEIANAVKGKK